MCERVYFSLVVCIASVTCCILLCGRVTCWTPDFYWESIFHHHNYHLLISPFQYIYSILYHIFSLFLCLFRTILLAWHHSSLLNMAACIRYLPRSNKFDVDCDTHFNNTLTLTHTHTHTHTIWAFAQALQVGLCMRASGWGRTNGTSRVFLKGITQLRNMCNEIECKRISHL